MTVIPEQSYARHAQFVPGVHVVTPGFALLHLIPSMVLGVRASALATLTTLEGIRDRDAIKRLVSNWRSDRLRV